MMSALQRLLDELLWDIYGKVSFRHTERENVENITNIGSFNIPKHSWKYSVEMLKEQSIITLTEISASMRMEIRIIGSYLTKVLITRDKKYRKQDVLCDIITATLKAYSNKSIEAKDMKFSINPPSPSRCELHKKMDATSSDFNQWLHAMKMVARLPGGMPPEFRRKLWLALADKYLQTKKVNWEREQEKCFSEQWREDDEELGIQIVKDLHRTGSSLCSGPTGSINQAKLKRILLGYARWNPEVGYCQGFNMLGALILQVMEKCEIESMKVMIFLVEGVLPTGYFSGSLGGLQADMAVFRELMTTKLPKLAKHLQKLQGPIGEGAFEPPLTNVFTMQWFLTLFCTCLPINCVLRVWDLVLIEGSDILLRTALAIWSLLEEKIVIAKSADDFYCRMGTLSGELLNGHLTDSNGLIEKVVELGPISELQRLRDKHLYNIAPWQDKKGLRFFFSDDDCDSDDDTIAVTTTWGTRLNRRGSSGINSNNKVTSEHKERIALDISLLKKQYERLRERQKQAHVILTAAVARQGVNTTSSPSMQVNQLLMGRNAIVTNKGRRIGPPQGAIPPARKVTPNKPVKYQTKQSKRGEHWQDDEINQINKSTPTYSQTEDSKELMAKTQPSCSPRHRKRSESSSYSEDSDVNSSTSTSLCDDDELDNCSSLEASPMRKQRSPDILPGPASHVNHILNIEEFVSSKQLFLSIGRTELTEASDLYITEAVNANNQSLLKSSLKLTELNTDEDSSAECDRFAIVKHANVIEYPIFGEKSNIVNGSASLDLSFRSELDRSHELLGIPRSSGMITSTSQLSPIADISKYLSNSNISPLKTPSTFFDYSEIISSNSTEGTTMDIGESFDISEEGVTNEYFERVNIVERPNRLDLLYSLNDSENLYDDPKKCGNASPKQEDKAQITKTLYIESSSQENFLPTYTKLSGMLAGCSTHNRCSNLSTESNIIKKSLDLSPLELSSYLFNSVDSNTRHHIAKEKSFSFDDATVVEKQEPRPTSCPEARADLIEGKIRSDHVLKIIEENSMILHRILRKNTLKTNADNDKNIDEINSIIINKTNTPTEVHDQMTLSFSPDNEKIDFMKLEVKSKLDTFDFQSSSTRAQISPTPLKYEYNIADRLASIKNTIKSIDSLCDDRNSYKKEKCQKYIDSLFEKARGNVTNVTTPRIQVHKLSAESLRKENNEDTDSCWRYSRDYKRDLSPRRRNDEDRQENESRARRDKMPKYFNNFRTIECSKINCNNQCFPTASKTDLNIDLNKNIEIDNIQDENGTQANIDTKPTVPSIYVPTKLDIRHTTVTSTFYDRFLSQKQERDAKVDKSPPTPVITKAYLDSLKPTTLTKNRNAKSAENSPTRVKFEPTLTCKSACSEFSKDLQNRSCDNILLTLKTNTISSTPYCPLPRKEKSSPEIGIQLGLFKSHTKESPVS